MKIKEQTRKLAVGCSKHCFEVVDKTDEVSSKHGFEVVDRTDEVSNHIYGKATLTWFEEIFEEYKKKAELEVNPILLLNSLKHFPGSLRTPWQIDKGRHPSKPSQRSPISADCV